MKTKSSKIQRKEGGSRPPVQRKINKGTGVQRVPTTAGPDGAFRSNMSNMGSVQPKMKVGPSNDHYEKQADSVADQVVSTKSVEGSGGERVQRSPISRGITPLVQRMEEEAIQEMPIQREEESVQEMAVQRRDEVQEKCEDCGETQRMEEVQEMPVQREEESVQEMPVQRMEEVQEKCNDCGAEAQTKSVVQREEEFELDPSINVSDLDMGEVQAKGFDNTSRIVEQDTTSEIHARKGRGKSLPNGLKEEMEQGFGADFSGVNIHTDSTSAALNKDLKAKAFTHGADVFFGAGQFDTESDGGKKLIAHELTHTIQQGAVKPDSATPVEALGQELVEEKQTDQANPLASFGIEATPSPEPVAPEKKAAAGKHSMEKVKNATPPTDSAIEKSPTAGLIATMNSSSMADGGKGDKTMLESMFGITVIKPPPPPEKKTPSEIEGETGGKEGQGLEPVNMESQLDLPQEGMAAASGIIDDAIFQEEMPTGPVFTFMDKETGEVCPDAFKKTQELAAAEGEHDSAGEKVVQAEEAQEFSGDDEEALGQGKQIEEVETLGGEVPKLSPEDKKKVFDAMIASKTPTTMEGFKDFYENNKGTEIGELMTQASGEDVKRLKSTFGQMEHDPKPIPQRDAKGLPGPEPVKNTPDFGIAQDAVPELGEAQKEVHHYKDAGDKAWEESGLTPDVEAETQHIQAVKDARAEKDGLDVKVDAAPKEIEGINKQQANETERAMLDEEKNAKKDMRRERDKKLKGADGDQIKAKSKFELAQEKVTKDINEIYSKVEKSVKDKLDNLEKKNQDEFGRSVLQYSEEFEDNAQSRIDDYLDERHSGVVGFFTSIGDWWSGTDDLPKVIEIFEDEKRIYTGKLDQKIKDISEANNQVIEACKRELAEARVKVANYIKGLKGSLQSHGKKVGKEINKKLDELDTFINEKQVELQQKLCDMKDQAIKHIDKKIEEMKEAMSGALSKLVGFLLDIMLTVFKGVLWAIGYSPDEIMGIISETKRVLTAIITQPLSFIGNLVDGVGKGINQFADNIKTHLVSGLINWLTGTMGDIEIELPDKWNLMGITSFILQLLGLSWNIIRQKLVKRTGEEFVNVLETGVDITKKLITEGPMALWEDIKAQADEMKATVMEEIRNFIVISLVREGIKLLVSALIPGAGFVKAVLAIYDTIMFFVENWESIVDWVKNMFNMIRDIVDGKIQFVADGTESAMGMIIPLILKFMAKLLHLDKISSAVQRAIKKIRKPIDKIVNKAIKKMVKLGRKLFGKKKGKGKKGKKEKKVEGKLTAQDKKKHKKYVDKIEEKLAKPPKKDPETFDEFYKLKKKEAKALEDKYDGKLRKKVNGRPLATKIEFGTLKSEEKDNDIDFKISIAPNTTRGRSTARYRGGGTTYPGSGIDPSRRGYLRLWKDLDPHSPLAGEKGNDAKKRTLIAGNALIDKYSKRLGNKKKVTRIVNSIADYKYGQAPRPFKSAMHEFSLIRGVHIHDRHVMGKGDFPTKYHQAVRAITNSPGSEHKGGFFLTLGGADGSVGKTIKQILGTGHNPKWEQARHTMVQKYTQFYGVSFENKIHLRGPLVGGTFNVESKENYSLPGDFPRYLQHESIKYKYHYGKVDLKTPDAVGERPLWKGDNLARRYGLGDLSKPMTEEFNARKTYARLVPDHHIRGGWYINSAWPSE